jgi:hypothetical protein
LASRCHQNIASNRPEALFRVQIRTAGLVARGPDSLDDTALHPTTQHASRRHDLWNFSDKLSWPARSELSRCHNWARTRRNKGTSLTLSRGDLTGVCMPVISTHYVHSIASGQQLPIYKAEKITASRFATAPHRMASTSTAPPLDLTGFEERWGLAFVAFAITVL